MYDFLELFPLEISQSKLFSVWADAIIENKEANKSDKYFKTLTLNYWIMKIIGNGNIKNKNDLIMKKSIIFRGWAILTKKAVSFKRNSFSKLTN